MVGTSILSLFALLAGDLGQRLYPEPKNAAEFYRLYKSYDLWLPTPDAKLVRTGSGEQVEFLLLAAPISDDNIATVRSWYGESKDHRPSQLHVLDPSVNIIEKHDWRGAQDLLFLAAVGQHLGWTEFATAAFEKAMRTAGYLGQIADWEQTAPGFTSGLLRERVWNENVRCLTDVRGDRGRAYRFLKRVFDEDSQFREPGYEQLIRDLEGTLRPKEISQDRVEHRIDQLIDWSGRLDGYNYRPSPSDPIGPYEEVVKLGFDAVPHLIAHLDDRRLTRAPDTFVLGKVFLQDVYRIGDVCLDILKALAAGELRSQEILTPEVWKLKAEQWYVRAKKVGEAEWYETHVMTQNPVSLALCRAFAERYPKQFARAYQTLLLKPLKVFDTRLVAALVHAKLAKSEKLELLKLGASRQLLDCRLGAMWGLSVLDSAEFRQSLPGYFQRMTTEEAGERYEEQLRDEIKLVLTADDPKCWAAFKDHLQKCSAGQRIFYVGASAPRLGIHKLRDFKRWFREVEMMWDDPSIRKFTGVNDQSPFGRDYPELAVRDFITLTFAELLDVEIPIDPKRAPAEWTKLRQKVATALRQARKKWETP